MRRAVRNAAIAVATVTLCTLLVACSSAPNDTVPMPVPMPTASASPSAASAPAPDRDPSLLPGGTALANIDFFDFVNTRLLAVNSNPSSSAIVENLINSGFDKSDLEVTADTTPLLGLRADSIQFAVRTSSGCMLGQFQAGNYSSVVGPVINGETCLVGETVPIP